MNTRPNYLAAKQLCPKYFSYDEAQRLSGGAPVWREDQHWVTKQPTEEIPCFT
jgi:hypothetical protein